MFYYKTLSNNMINMIRTTVKNIVHKQENPSIIQLSHDFSNIRAYTRKGTSMVHIKG